MDYSSPPQFGSGAQVPFRSGRQAPRLHMAYRLVLVSTSCVLASILLTAWRLTPDARGLGTHQQLGLAPCTVVQWFGVRCPSCGMTTAWSHLVHGQPVAALKANAGGVLLAVLAILAVPWLLLSGVMGRSIVPLPADAWLFGAAIVILAATLAQWAIRVSLGI